MHTTLTTPAERIYAERFRYGTPRSEAYRQGFMAGLRRQLEERRIEPPYEWGTSRADAFAAGRDEAYIHLQWIAGKSEAAS